MTHFAARPRFLTRNDINDFFPDCDNDGEHMQCARSVAFQGTDFERKTNNVHALLLCKGLTWNTIYVHVHVVLLSKNWHGMLCRSSKNCNLCTGSIALQSSDIGEHNLCVRSVAMQRTNMEHHQCAHCVALQGTNIETNNRPTNRVHETWFLYCFAKH